MAHSRLSLVWTIRARFQVGRRLVSRGQPLVDRFASAWRELHVQAVRFSRVMADAKWARFLASTALIVIVAEAPLHIGAMFTRHTAETDAYDRVYYTALLTGRSTDAALRKAQFRTDLLMREFGMTRSEAAAQAAQSMIWSAGNLCSGG